MLFIFIQQVEGSQSVDIHQFLYYSEIREKIKDAVVELLSADTPIILHFEVKYVQTVLPLHNIIARVQYVGVAKNMAALFNVHNHLISQQ